MNFHESLAGFSPASRLRVAIKAGDTVLLRRVLAAHPGVLDLPDEQGRTPLHLAAEWQQLGVVRALVAAGADVDATDPAGDTPRDSALWSGECSMGAHTKVCQQIVACLDAGKNPLPDGARQP